MTTDNRAAQSDKSVDDTKIIQYSKFELLISILILSKIKTSEFKAAKPTKPAADEPVFKKTPSKKSRKMPIPGGSVVRNFTLAPLFTFIVSIFSHTKQEEQKEFKPEHQSYKALLGESEQNLSRMKVYYPKEIKAEQPCQRALLYNSEQNLSRTKVHYPTSSQSVRTFTFALLKYIDTITDGPSNIDRDMIELLWRMKNALSNHDDALNELTALSYGELDEEKRRSLSEAIERGVKTNAIIVKFVWDCCHDGHPRGLLKHRLKTAFFSDQLERATDGELSVIYAYKFAKGDALLS